MEHVRYERDGDVAEIILSSPPLNLFGQHILDALPQMVGRAAADGPRALLVRAEGKVFTAGVDVRVFSGLERAAAAELVARGMDLMQAIEDLPFPTVAAVHGLCLTAGLELALGCDMLLASDDARFGLVEKVVGITPLWGGTQRMAERAGTARAREFVMTGGLYPAATLEAWGVVNRVIPRDDLLAEARAFAAELAAGPTIAHAATKAIVRAQADHGTRGADARTPALTAPLFETEDSRNAVVSFLAEGPGKATYRGR